jgi:hypothetical protein
MQAHVGNDVKQSVGLVVISDWLELIDVGLIFDTVEWRIRWGCYNNPNNWKSKMVVLFV